MSETLKLGLVFSALGVGAVTSALGTLTGTLGSIEKKVTQSQSRIRELGLESVDAFSRQKKALIEARAEADQHSQATQALGRAVAQARVKQEASTQALFRAELAMEQSGRATAEQKERVKALRQEVRQAEQNLKGLTREFTAAGAQSDRMNESVQNQTARLQKLRGALHGAELAMEQSGRAAAEQKARIKALHGEVSQAEQNLKRLTGEFAAARAQSDRMNESVQNQTARLQKLRGTLAQNGIATGKLAEHHRRITQMMKTEQATIDRLTARYEKLKSAQAKMQGARADLNSRMGDAMAAYGTMRMLGAPIGAFVRQDDALNSLQVAMMDKNGQVNASYDALKRQAIELGNLLPGTTTDFVNTARALMEQGVALESVLNGGLKAASYLSVVMHMPAEDAGEMAAKLREAYKLSDNELTKMADAMQRAKFAFGMKPSDLMGASSYMAPSLNQLGITGMENVDKMLAIQGMGAQVGLERSLFGTNFSQMLSRLSKGPLMIEEAKKGMKAHARELMEEMNITFKFFDDKGNFAGLDNMMAELGKLDDIKKKLGDKAAMDIAEAMFGAEAARPALILGEAGLEGYKKAQERMAEQADLNQRIQKISESTANTFERLGGSLENFGAALTGPAVQWLHPFINLLNDAAGWLTTFAEKNPRATKALGLLVLSLGAAVSGFFALGIALSAGRLVTSGFQLFSALTLLGRSASWLGGVLKGPLAAALGLAKGAVIKLGLALMATPLGWIAAGIAGIAAGAVLIYRYWEPIKGFFLGIGEGLKSGLAPVIDALSPALAALGLVFQALFAPILPLIRWVISGFATLGGWIKGLIAPVQDTGNAARGLGEAFGQGIAKALMWVGELVAKILFLPARMFQAGVDIVNGLTSGIRDTWDSAKQAVGELGSNIKNKFKSVLGIQSPSTVFLELGGHIGQGAALGILKSLKSVQGAAGQLAGVAMAGMLSASQALAGAPIPVAVQPRIMPVAPQVIAGQGFGEMLATAARNPARDDPPPDSMLSGLQAAVQALSGLPPAAPGSDGAFGSDAAGMTLHFAPNITVTAGAGGGDVGGQVREAMQWSVRDLEQMLRRIQAERDRRSF
jgi:TP901 family phage tail tape measure protein